MGSTEPRLNRTHRRRRRSTRRISRSLSTSGFPMPVERGVFGLSSVSGSNSPGRAAIAYRAIGCVLQTLPGSPFAAEARLRIHSRHDRVAGQASGRLRHSLAASQRDGGRAERCGPAPVERKLRRRRRTRRQARLYTLQGASGASVRLPACVAPPRRTPVRLRHGAWSGRRTEALRPTVSSCWTTTAWPGGRTVPGSGRSAPRAVRPFRVWRADAGPEGP